jgi:hypothetical protein
MRRLAAAIPFALLLVFAAGCGGAGTGPASEPRTVEDLTSWLKDAGECDGVETDVARLPVPPARYEQVAPGLERFDKQANYAALIGCGGANGFISYFRFPSAAARAAAVRERNGLIANELFCAQGTELVINELLGYDNTIGFCKKLHFPIHHPTHVYSAATESRREELAKATRISAHANHLPPADIFCEPLRGSPHEFRCEPFTGGGSEIVTLTD